MDSFISDIEAQLDGKFNDYASLEYVAKADGSVALVPGADPSADVVPIAELVEKPPAETAPSTLAIIGRYVLPPEIFDALRETPPGAKDEIQLTDALAELATQEGEGGGVYGVVFRGRRYDTGDKLSYLKANIELACEREDLGPGLRAWIKDYARDLEG